MTRGLKKAMVVLAVGGLLAATPAAAFASSDHGSSTATVSSTAQVSTKADSPSKDRAREHDRARDRREGEKPDPSKDGRDGSNDGGGDSLR
jgi:hypothetical protein